MTINVTVNITYRELVQIKHALVTESKSYLKHAKGCEHMRRAFIERNQAKRSIIREIARIDRGATE